MGIRFRCHQCGHELHVKDFQGGKRGKCPACEIRFRIPESDADFSIPVEDVKVPATSALASAANVAVGSSGTVQVHPSAKSPSAAVSQSSVTQRSVTQRSVTNKADQETPAAQKVASSSKTPMAGGSASDEPVAAKTNGKTADGKTADKKIVEGKRTANLEADRLAEKTERSETKSRESATQESAAAKLDGDGEPLAGIRNKVPQAIVEAPGATWYVRPPSGGQFGPAPAEIFHEWLVENRVTRDSLVWRDGWPQWLVASDVFTDFFGPSLATTTAIAPTAPSIANTAAIESTTDRTRLTRKMKRRRRYIIGIAMLATLAIILVVTLIVVLMQG